MAARAAAFNFSPRAPNNSTQESEASAPPRPPARRISSNNSDSDPPPTPARKGLGAGTTGKLVQQKVCIVYICLKLSTKL